MSGPLDGYHITELSELTAHLRDLWVGAVLRRCSARLHDSIQHAVGRMTNDPRDWGDPLYRLNKMKLGMYRGIADLVICYYGVHDLNREVFWSKIVANPSSPLGETGYTYPT